MIKGVFHLAQAQEEYKAWIRKFTKGENKNKNGNKYQVVRSIGKSGAGKDSIQKQLVNFTSYVSSLLSVALRPSRERRKKWRVDYHFISLNEFTRKVLNGDMLEATSLEIGFMDNIDSVS